MGAKKLKALREEVDKTLGKIQKRTQYYAEGAMRVRTTLLAYFFDAKIINTLTESPAVSEEMFNFNEASESLKACLVDERELVAKAETIKTNETPSLVGALDANILASQLPLIRNGFSYSFSPKKPYTPKAQMYMQQFAHALSIYRVCLGICESYHIIINHACLNIREHSESIAAAEELQEQLTKPDNLTPVINSWRDAKRIKRQANRLTAEIDSFTSDFERTMAHETVKLMQLFEQGASLLQDSYKLFPNTSWFFSDQWRNMSKEFADFLYLGKYSSSSYYGTLTVNVECREVKQEIAEFHDMTIDRLPILKTELLVRAYQVINKCISVLKIEASRKKIPLNEVSDQGIFSQKNSLYWGLVSALASNNSQRGGSLEINQPEISK